MRYKIVPVLLVAVFCLTFGGVILGAFSHWWILSVPGLCIGICAYEAAEMFFLRHSLKLRVP